MAADPYGEGTDETVNDARRRAQLEALNDGNPNLANPGFQTDFFGNDNEGPAPSNSSSTQLPEGTLTLPTSGASAPTSSGGSSGGGGAMQQASRPAFQPPMSFGSGWVGVAIADATPAKAPVITDEVTALLRERLKSLGQPMDITNDPIYQNQIQAFNVQSQRDADRTRAAEAQRRAVSGTGGLSTAVRSINESQGARNQAFGANLASERFQQREAQLNQAISFARAVGQDDVAMQLENEKLKLAVEALRVQQSLGQQDIDLRSFLGQGQLGLGYDQLGYNYADLINRANRDAVIAAL